MAHRLAHRDEAHGARFVGALIGLVCRHDRRDAYELMALADSMGVRYHIRSVGAVPIITISAKVERLIERDGPMREMDIACELDVSYLQVRGAAMYLIRQRKARWLRKKLHLTKDAP